MVEQFSRRTARLNDKRESAHNSPSLHAVSQFSRRAKPSVFLLRFNKTKALKIEEIEFGMEGSKIEIPVNSLYFNGIELVRVSL